MGKIIVLDAVGRVLAAGDDTSGLTAPDGGSIVPAPDTIHDDIRAAEQAAGVPVDLVWKKNQVATRPRAKTAVELDGDERLDLAGKLKTFLDGWDTGTLTPAQKDQALKLCIRAAYRAVK